MELLEIRKSIWVLELSWLCQMAVHVVTIKRAATNSYLISILDRLKTSLMRLVWFVSFSCYGMGVKPLWNLSAYQQDLKSIESGPHIEWPEHLFSIFYGCLMELFSFILSVVFVKSLFNIWFELCISDRHLLVLNCENYAWADASSWVSFLFTTRVSRHKYMWNYHNSLELIWFYLSFSQISLVLTCHYWANNS